MTSTKRKTREPRESTRKRRDEVLESAARVFHKKGYDATSIQDIADELGILKGSVYYYITSKEDVLFELLDQVHKAALDAALEAVETDGDPLQKIRAFVQTLSEFNAGNRVRMGVLLRDFRSLSNKRRRQIVHERDRYDQILRELVIDGQRQGLICPDIDPKLATLAAMGMINSICQWYRPAGGQRPGHIGSAYADLVIGSLSCTPQTHTPGHLAERGALPSSSQGKPEP